MERLSLKRDFLQNPTEETIQFPGIGGVKMADYGVDERDALVRFYNKNYRPEYILGNSKLFNWMFKNNGGYVKVLVHEGNVVAHQGHIPVVFTNGNEDHRGFISSSTMVDSDYRRRGLMSRLRESVQDKYEMAESLGGSAQGVALYSSMGYKRYGDLNRLAIIINKEKCNGVSKNTESLRQVKASLGTVSESIKPISDFAEIKGELDLLWNEVFKPGTYFSVKRDAEFLDWRYTEHPIFKYEKFGLWKSGVLVGVVVYRLENVEKENTSLLRIVELIGEASALSELIKGTVLSEDISSKVGWADFSFSDDRFNSTLRPLGFMDKEELMPSILPIFCNPVDYYKESYPLMFWSKDKSRYDGIPDIDKWYVTKGDGDADRPN